MGRVAHERKPLGDEAPGDLEPKRKRLDSRGEADFAQFWREAVFELARQLFGIQRKQRARVGATLVPDNARLAAGKGQNRERTGRQEMLLRAAFVIAVVRDRRDDSGLVIVPADGLNVGEPAEFRARAVGGDSEARPQGAAVG